MARLAGLRVDEIAAVADTVVQPDPQPVPATLRTSNPTMRGDQSEVDYAEIDDGCPASTRDGPGENDGSLA